MTSFRGLLRQCESALLNAGDTSQRTSAAFAAGVFLSFSPLLGFQILLAAILAWAFKLNRVLLFVGLCANLPWLMAPYYAAATEAAAWAMGVVPPSQLGAQLADAFRYSVLSGAFWRELAEVLLPLFWPFVIGSTVAAAVLALVAYRVGLLVATARREQAAQPGLDGL